MEATLTDFSLGLFLIQIFAFLFISAILYVVYRVLRKLLANK